MINQMIDYLFVLAVILFFIEFSLFYFIRSEVKDRDVYYDLTIDQIAQVIKKIKDAQILFFLVIYLLIIMLARFVPFLLYLLISYQFISVAFDLFIWVKIKKEE
jgi:hypothetical protein